MVMRISYGKIFRNLFIGTSGTILIVSLVFPHISLVSNAQVMSVEEREAQLRAELEKTEKEIAQWQATLNSKRSETASIKRDADILTAKIEQAKLVIKAKNLAIDQLGKEINQKNKTIETLEERLERGRESLSQLLRKTNEIDSFSVVEVALSNQNVSEFFSDLDSYDSIKRSLNELFQEIQSTKSLTEAEKQALDERRDKETDAKAVVETEKRGVEKNEAEKKKLLAISKSQEKTYEQVLADRQKKAAQIRAALFALRDTAAIPFGTALTYANQAYQKTGVRPAFLLAILQQESNLGQSVGSCLITNLQNGETRSVNSGKVFKNGIHPTRDLPILKIILPELGRDPLMTKVSCPLSIGYGGAMGPAQFIPSTWNLMKTKIAAAVGKSVPDPWDASDAFMASALYLKDLGASVGGYTAERNAACRYYSGKACSAGTGASYGNSVMAKATNIQENMIDPLQGL